MTKRLCRAAERYPPADREYRTPAAKGRQIPPDASAEQRQYDQFLPAKTGHRETPSWDALSAWDMPEAAIVVARRSLSARFVVCFDIPDDSGVTYEPSGPPGHFDIRGDLGTLKRYLTDVKLAVDRGGER